MKKSIEISYNLTNHQELEDALNFFHVDSYKVIFDDEVGITPSVLCNYGGESVGAMFFTEDFYKVTVYDTHVIFDPKVNYVDFKRTNKNQK